MPWSAKHIAPQSSLAMKTARVPAGGDFSWAGQVPTIGTPPSLPPTPPPAAAPAVNPQANQRTDPKIASATPTGTKTAAQALQSRVGVAAGLKDKKLGSRSPSTAPAVSPGSLIQASTFKSPYAPAFLTDAVTDLNETNSYTAMMHDEWRNTLLRASEGNAGLTPALAAASVQPGAKFSLGLGGGYGSGSGAPTQRQPSYWEQKLAQEDFNKARDDLIETNKSLQFWDQNSGLGVGMSPGYKDAQMLMLKKRQQANLQSSALAQKVLGDPGKARAGSWASQFAGSDVPAASGWW